VAQRGASASLIVETIDDNQLVTLSGNTHPAANARNDRGSVITGLSMTDLILVLKRSPEQQAAFDAFVESQYDATSPNYHHWLEPKEVGEQFGPSLTDIAAISGWLTGHGLSVDDVSNDRMTIRFSGTAGQVERTFHTQIHNLSVKGEAHIANMSDPQIPMALDQVVVGVKALHNFYPRPLHHLGGKATLNPETGAWQNAAKLAAANKPAANAAGIKPDTGFTCGSGCQVEDVTPYDFAAIYNVAPLWSASTPIDGTGQTIAIAATSRINPADVTTFRSTFGLPAGPALQTILATTTDPGKCTAQTAAAATFYCTLEDQIENALDVEWSGAVAKNAQIVLVVSGAASQSTDTVYASSNYVVQHNTAKILNVSYGECELGLGTAGNLTYKNLWQTAASQGIAVFVASGDSGSPACDQGMDSSLPYAAEFGLSVSGLASTQYNTAVGGTDLNWGSTASPYWNTSNNSTNHSSAKGYMPEVPWNSTCTNPIVVPILEADATTIGVTGVTDAESACSFVAQYYSYIYTNYNVDLSWLVDSVGAGGGASNCINGDQQNTTSCTQGYPKPSWQSNVTGIPNDSKRDIPDVSFFASNGFLGSAYLICVSDWGACVTSATTTEPNAGEIGGTSAASPAMAGVMALINQKAGSPQGNPNAELYTLGGKQTYASCKSETGTTSNGCYFNDVVTGTIAMACDPAAPNCSLAHSTDLVGILSGYAATTGFDLATGLGTLNVANVVNAWAATTGTGAATVTLTPSASSIKVSQSMTVQVAVSGSSGTPTGTVVLNGGGFNSATQTLASGSYTFAIPANALTAGSVTLTATYSGDATYASKTGTTAITVTALATPTVTVTPSVSTLVKNQSMTVQVAVAGSSGTPTGTVVLNGGGFSSATQTLASGAYTFAIPASSLSVGTDPLTVTYNGDATYGTATGTTTVTVTAPPLLTPTVTVTPASSTIDSGQSLSVGVAVSGTGGTPTGTVVLNGGGFSSATVSLASGSYSFAIPANKLSAGTDALTVSYGGDSVYTTATGSANVTVTQSTFSLSASATAAVNRGSSASSTISVTTTNNYSGTVTLGCALTSGPTNSATDKPACSVPTTAIATGATGTATVTTKAATTAGLVRPAIPGKIKGLLDGGAVLALLVMLGIPSKRRSLRAMLGVLMLTIVLGGLAACGGGSGGGGGGGGGSSDPGTASGTYTFTVTGTGNPTQSSGSTTTFTVTVN
jgi:hypothetical protein